MKGLTVFLVFVCSLMNVYGEEGLSAVGSGPFDTPVAISELNVDDNLLPDGSFDYTQTPEWRKYKKLRTLGWCTLGVGVAVMVFGSSLTNYMNDYYGEVVIGVAVASIGGVVALASIPLFISASRNKNKAMNKFSLGLTQIQEPKFNTVSKNVPALSFVYRF